MSLTICSQILCTISYIKLRDKISFVLEENSRKREQFSRTTKSFRYMNMKGKSSIKNLKKSSQMSLKKY